MKKPELITDVDAFIESMIELKARYQAALDLGISKRNYEIKNGYRCLLCNPIGGENSYEKASEEIDRSHIDNRHKQTCAFIGCPWIVITGLTCDEWSRENLAPKADNLKYIYPVYSTENPVYMQNRIDQLDEWIEMYMEFKRKQ